MEIQMNAAIDLINSCKNNVFPSIATLSTYGMNGEGKTNPVDIWNCYKIAITENKINEHDLCNCTNLNTLLKEKVPSLHDNSSYKRVMENGGIVISNLEITECSKCFYNGLPKKCC